MGQVLIHLMALVPQITPLRCQVPLNFLALVFLNWFVVIRSPFDLVDELVEGFKDWRLRADVDHH